MRSSSSVVVGSPPRAWGRLRIIVIDRHEDRFTPTCVGTALNHAQTDCQCAVHPHVRGDGATRLRISNCRPGSPPRAWGRRGVPEVRVQSWRFTPTCVGTARARGLRRRVITVHPHVRGDGATCDETLELNDGSPPRAWGRQDCGQPADCRLRFTPTCVGTAIRALPTATDAAVHPHVRGDGGQARFCERQRYGSPPRAWGRR